MELANRMGANWNYQHPSDIMAEMASLTPLFEGASFERLEGYKTLQWPVAQDGSDQPVLYLNGFPFPDNKARLYPVSFREPEEALNDDFDLFLNNGRMLEHFHEGNMTHRVDGIREETAGALPRNLGRVGKGARHRVRTMGSRHQPSRLAGDQGTRDEPGIRKGSVSAAVIAERDRSTS